MNNLNPKKHVKHAKRKKSSKPSNSLLHDVAIMVVIHCVITFTFITFYSTIKTSSSTTKPAGAIKKNKNRSPPLSTFQNMDQKQTQQNNHILYEAGYPKISNTHYFPTFASEKEMAKHDRYIVHGMLYMEMLNQKYLDRHWNIMHHHQNTNYKQNKDAEHERKISMNIFMKHDRSQPYISALMMSLMMSHEEEEEINADENYRAGYDLLSFVELNLFDTTAVQESDDGDDDVYDRQRQKVLSLPFLNVFKKSSTATKPNNNNNHHHHHNSNYHLHHNNTQNTLNQIEDYLKVAHQCIQSNLDYCLIMQEYTIVPIDFMDSIKSIISTIESEQLLLLDTTKSSSSTTTAVASSSMISLFSAYDHELQSIIKIHDVNYSRDIYPIHKGYLNSERKSLGLEEYKSEYTIHKEDSVIFDGGYNVAVLFHMDTVKEYLVPFLKVMNERSLNGGSSGSSFDLEREYLRYYKEAKKYTVEPSLVNRIGFYDEDYHDDESTRRSNEDNNDNGSMMMYDERLGITNWLTDTRFVFEAGEYWEGREKFCQKDNGEWIEDEFYYDDGDKSSCKGDKKG